MNLLDQLRELLGPEHVLTDPAQTAGYTTDWTRRYTGNCLAVVRPAGEEQVAAILRTAYAAGVAITPQGGNTGLVAGSIPGPAEGLVLSTTRLRALGPVTDRGVTAGAGVTLAALQQHARAAGLEYGVDLGSRESATVGGTISTDAGGLRVVAFGTTRDQVISVRGVRADGEAVESRELIAAEGTLAVITAATLRLVDPLPQRTTAFVPVEDMSEAVALLRPGLLAAEYVERSVLRLTGGPDVFAGVVLEVTDPSYLPDSAIIATDHHDVRRLWGWRELAGERVATRGISLKLDVSLPLERLATFRAELDAATAGSDLYLWGHLAEGRLHVNLLDADAARHTESVLQLVIENGGDTCSEHGVGRAKVDWFARQHPTTELQRLRERKRRFDPSGILNPGVILR